ncbi:MAG TPA: hypothetical protein VGP89_04700 [Candidatus Angelobacter sp.]|nr:hypothetical protein [Candidatus Angelobacter sp.]
MKRLLPFLLALSTLPAWGQSSTGHERRYELRPDPSWPLEIDLSSGDYQIVASASDSITVVYEEGSPEARRKIDVQIASGHGLNQLKVAGPNSHFHAVIEIPRKTDLRVRMNAGGLTVGDVEGNKDIEVRAGSLKLDALRPQDYAQADFSVRIGDVYAPLFKDARNGLPHSFQTVGRGKYHLHAHVGVGDLTLRPSRI